MSYSPTLGRWLEDDKGGYVDGNNLYQMESSDPVSLLDPMGSQAKKPTTRPAAPDQKGWDKQKQAAQDALNYWIEFLNLRMGNDQKGGPITDACTKKLLDVIRAMSWVESHHGTVGQNHPEQDPMQSGNPNDHWWQSIQGQDPPDRIVGGPGKGNWNLGDLPGVTGIPAPPNGHNDPKFTPEMSYLWGVLGLIQKMNTGPDGGGRTYRCGDCSWGQLIAGATAYNGGGDPNYEQKIKDALKMFGSGPQ